MHRQNMSNTRTQKIKMPAAYLTSTNIYNNLTFNFRPSKSGVPNLFYTARLWKKNVNGEWFGR